MPLTCKIVSPAWLMKGLPDEGLSGKFGKRGFLHKFIDFLSIWNNHLKELI